MGSFHFQEGLVKLSKHAYITDLLPSFFIIASHFLKKKLLKGLALITLVSSNDKEKNNQKTYFY